MITADGRQVYIPRNRDSVEDLCCLADCIAGSKADLFNDGGRIILLRAGSAWKSTAQIS